MSRPSSVPRHSLRLPSTSSEDAAAAAVRGTRMGALIAIDARSGGFACSGAIAALGLLPAGNGLERQRAPDQHSSPARLSGVRVHSGLAAGQLDAAFARAGGEDGGEAGCLQPGE